MHVTDKLKHSTRNRRPVHQRQGFSTTGGKICKGKTPGPVRWHRSRRWTTNRIVHPSTRLRHDWLKLPSEYQRIPRPESPSPGWSLGGGIRQTTSETNLNRTIQRVSRHTLRFELKCRQGSWDKHPSYYCRDEDETATITSSGDSRFKARAMVRDMSSIDALLIHPRRSLLKTAGL